MKLFVVLAVAVACACAADLQVSPTYRQENNAGILRQSFDMSPPGKYEWVMETENGIESGAQGEVKYFDTDHATNDVQGYYKYISPEGEHIEMSYKSDENGYQPVGSHLPTPPPIPPMILRALEYIAAHPAVEYKPVPSEVYKKF